MDHGSTEFPQIDHDPETALGSADFLQGRRVAFVGKLGSMNRREAVSLVRRLGATPVSSDSEDADLVILGADAWPLEAASHLTEAQRRAAATGELSVLSETGFWEQLGFVDPENKVRRLYTPAMLASLLNVSVRVIRGWMRRGLITPVQEIHRLPYFDFQEVVAAKKLGQLLASGVSVAVLQERLKCLATWIQGVDRPLAQLSIIEEGGRLLMRSTAGLIDHRGQHHFEFSDTATDTESAGLGEHERDNAAGDSDHAAIVSLPMRWTNAPSETTWQVYVCQAEVLEEAGHVIAAIDAYRSALLASGPRSELNFALAELLYRTGDLSAARERYLCAIELDPDLVEARANLGCVLFELGCPELAAAAMQGALDRHADYPDAHYHLARFLDHLQMDASAESHWRAFLELAADSPWAEEARDRLGLLPD